MGKEYDPCMHTAEHVLNQTMVRLFGCSRAFSSHLNADKSKCDYHFLRPLAAAEAVEIERRVNAVLTQGLPVWEEVLPRAEAASRVVLDRLPEHVGSDAETPVRLVGVGDYDLCPCIGEHVANTAEIGLFRLVSHDFTPAETGEGILRIRFKLKRSV